MLRSLAKAVYYPLYRTGVRAQCLGHRIRDAAARREGPLPPPELRFRVAGDPAAERFIRVGRETVSNLEACLKATGRSIDSFESVLDFGAGCGRTLIPLSRQLPGSRIHGVDTDREAIEWCARNLLQVDARPNPAEPPLPFDTDSFDLIYAVSVFTHLGPDMEAAWLAELRRVLSPGGVALLTVYSRESVDGAGELEEVERKGIVFRESRKLEGFFPQWYQTCFRSEAYTRERFGQYFDNVEYLRRGLGDLDCVVCQTQGSVSPA